MKCFNRLHNQRIRHLYAMMVLFGVIFTGSSGLAQQQTFFFEHLGTEDGLSMANVNVIVRDQHGFMWIGTEDGLNRYDGYEFKVYYHDADNKNSLTNSFIETLLIDSQNRLWVGTRKGINQYIPEKDHFVQYLPSLEKPYHINTQNAKELFEDCWNLGSDSVRFGLYHSPRRTVLRRR